MSKRQIRGKYGTQLYLNKFFNRGMLYTSSEMQEGWVKSLTNYDITHTGDSALPRKPYSLVGFNNPNGVPISLGEFTYPVKFQQSNEQHYVEFTKTIHEDEFANVDIGDTTTLETSPLSSINMFSRNRNALSNIDFDGVLDPEDKLFKGMPKIDLTGKQDLSTPENNAPPYVKEDLYWYWEKSFSGHRVKGLDLPEGVTEIPITEVKVVDGDTLRISNQHLGGEFSRDSEDLRILGIDTPELSEEWGVYSKNFLEGIIRDDVQKIFVLKDPKSDAFDEHGRLLMWVFVSFDTKFDVCFLISEIMAKLGMAKLAYLYGNYMYNDRLLKAQDYAKDNELRIWSQTETDPDYKYYKNNVELPKFEYGDPVEDYDNVTVYAVRIDDSRSITHNLSNAIKKVQFVYLDYLDAIGFIGLVVAEKDGVAEIVYKGLILLKCKIVEEYPNFVIQTATNEGEGYKPSILEAISTGYNLYNTELISTDNSQIFSQPTNILGILPVDPNDDTKILTKVVPAQKVRLKGIINEGSSNNISVQGISNVKFDVRVTITTTYAWKGWDKVGDVETPITGAKTVTQGTFDFNESENYRFSHYISFEEALGKQDIEYYGKVWEATTHSYNYTVHLSIDDFKPIKYQSNTPSSQFSIGNTINFYTDIREINGRLEVVLKNNLNNPDYIFDDNGELIIREQKLPKQYFSLWEKSVASNVWTPLKEMYLNYESVKDVIQLAKGTTNFIDITIEEIVGFQVKYSLIPAVSFVSSKFPDKTFHLYNKFQVVYQVMPILNVGHTIESISNEDLKSNLQIRNATRIGVFNRHLFVYGKYTGANFIQFSLFENPWYFSFPFYNVEFDEPIIHVHQHKDSLIVFGQHSIYMLSGSTNVLELLLFKIYENLSIHHTDIDTIASLGNNIMFFNKQMGYVIVPNKYTNNPEDIQIFKLSESVSNLLTDPSYYIKQRFHLTRFPSLRLTRIYAKHKVFVENNVVNLVVGYSTGYDLGLGFVPLNFTVFYRYDQKAQRWSLYDTMIFQEINTAYVCEPQLGEQFVVKINNQTCLATTIDNELPEYFNERTADIGIDKIYPIETFVDSGNLSVDTMNEKRFKDLLFEFNNIGGSSLKLYCNFFVDGEAYVISDPESLSLVEGSDYDLIEGKPMESCIDTYDTPGFKLSESNLGLSDRVRTRFPVAGKGRMPSFTLAIQANDIYEFLNFSLLYKEKKIEKRR